MAGTVTIEFKPFGPVAGGDLVLLVGDDLKLASGTAERLAGAQDLVARAAVPERFKGKAQSVMAVAPLGALAAERLVVVGLGGEKDRSKLDFATLGGLVAGRLKGRRATVVLDLAGGATAEDAAELGLGARLRLYGFETYKTRRKPEDEGDEDVTRITIQVADAPAARRAAKAADAVAAGVILARDLVNEPPNVLDPAEFARRADTLVPAGVEVEVLDDARMAELGFRALLAVGQGSEKESRVVLMRWNGGKANDKPLAVVGKGVTFDSGGISIKPGGGMEEMKGDMGGAACVVGLMHALATRKARVNVVGAIGVVENMPDGRAQRPGDIVTTLSGQTVEIVNTDAEGRLVLADVLWHVQETFKPRLMIDLATLTGAILVALAQEHAGLFANDDELASRLTAAGEATGEKVWRMPLGSAYDKLIDSKFADMKNTGGRHGGSITAAQFLQRFVKDTPWAHLDVAGTAMNAPQTEINRSWGSGWGVRLLDRLIRDHYEG